MVWTTEKDYEVALCAYERGLSFADCAKLAASFPGKPSLCMGIVTCIDTCVEKPTAQEVWDRYQELLGKRDEKLRR